MEVGITWAGIRLIAAVVYSGEDFGYETTGLWFADTTSAGPLLDSHHSSDIEQLAHEAATELADEERAYLEVDSFMGQ